MDAFSQNLAIAPDIETKLLKRLVWISVVVHLIILFFNPYLWLFRSHPDVPDWVIEAELVDMGQFTQERPDSVKDAVQGEEISIREKSLPQVTKKFALEDQKDTSEKISDPDPEDKTLGEKAEISKEKVKEFLAPKPTVSPADESIKKIALDRLLKEKARQEKKFAKETSSPLNENLLKRKEELKNLAKGYSLVGMNTGYGGVLKKWISRRYTLPDIYNYKDSNIRATVQVILDLSGNIQNINLIESSLNPVFDNLVLKTIQDASPFPSPPPDWVGKVISFPFEPGKRM